MCASYLPSEDDKISDAIDSICAYVHFNVIQIQLNPLTSRSGPGFSNPRLAIR